MREAADNVPVCPSSGVAALGAKGQKEHRASLPSRSTRLLPPPCPPTLMLKRQPDLHGEGSRGRENGLEPWKGVGRGDKKRVHSGDTSKKLLMNFGESGVDRKP